MMGLKQWYMDNMDIFDDGIGIFESLSEDDFRAAKGYSDNGFMDGYSFTENMEFNRFEGDYMLSELGLSTMYL